MHLGYLFVVAFRYCASGFVLNIAYTAEAILYIVVHPACMT